MLNCDKIRRMKSSKRPSWESYFLTIAQQVKTRSTCLRRQTGAILVRDKRILTTGYNGAPRGLRHCLEIGCLRESQGVASGERHELCRGLHAEQNAILQAAVHGVSVDKAVLYTTHFPCSLCAKMLINAGVLKVFYLEEYSDQLSLSLFQEAGIIIKKLSI